MKRFLHIVLPSCVDGMEACKRQVPCPVSGFCRFAVRLSQVRMNSFGELLVLSAKLIYLCSRIQLRWGKCKKSKKNVHENNGCLSYQIIV